MNYIYQIDQEIKHLYRFTLVNVHRQGLHLFRYLSVKVIKSKLVALNRQRIFAHTLNWNEDSIQLQHFDCVTIVCRSHNPRDSHRHTVWQDHSMRSNQHAQFSADLYLNPALATYQIL